MAYDVAQFKALIEETLHNADPKLADPVAVKLLLGTAAQESAFGKYFKQKSGPAVGAFQMEPGTFEWLQAHYSEEYPQLIGRGAPEMRWDLKLAILMARLRYRIAPWPLPEDNVQELAKYWKQIYNTKLGKGTPEQFIENYERFGLNTV